MKRLIINGDDYGYNPEKSEGILKAHTEGILTSTTLMVNIVS
ncbi:ChbG/HpnK family deacetylase, partial [Candidatus Woesearchaeota archaeon]|nr:ChbG/HpnK family deacetylase [Candidatus Woesearchaeota archaeon]